MSGQSLLSVAAWWVAWVYALSISLTMVLGPIESSGLYDFNEVFHRWAREVAFASPGMTVSGRVPDGLANLRAVATTPAPLAGHIPIQIEELTARNGGDFEVAKRGAAIYFEKGATDGTLRMLPGWGPDIRVVTGEHWKEPRSFRLRLQNSRDAVSAGDLAMCTVTIDDGSRAIDRDLIPIRFAGEAMTVPLSRLAETPLEIFADSAVAEEVPVTFKLFRLENDNRQQLGAEFTKTLTKGDRRMSLRLHEMLSPDELERNGLADDGLPGLDETLEVELMAPAPLFPDGERTCRITAENTNKPPQSRLVYFDANKKEIDYLDPEGFVTLEYTDTSSRNRTSHNMEIDGERLPGEIVIEPRARRGNLLPLAGKDWGGRLGRRCGVSSVCGSGCAKGQANCSARALCGEPVEGDYMLILVNNERLHEQGDRIVEQVRNVLSDKRARPFGNEAIILNPGDEDVMTEHEGVPDPAKRFRPFSEENHDVAGQLARIESVVARKREAAAKPDLRAVVVWPERDLASRTGVRPVVEDVQQPFSFLLPDADPSYSREIQKGLVPGGQQRNTVTVRAPKETELQAHLTNVIVHGSSAGKGGEP